MASLHQRYGLGTPAGALGQLQAIMGMQLHSLAADYHRRSGDAIGDNILRAIVIKNCPEPLKSHLQLQGGRFANFDEMREYIVDWARSRSGWAQPSGSQSSGSAPSPMQVDYLGKGPKGKRKGKGNESPTTKVRRRVERSTHGHNGMTTKDPSKGRTALRMMNQGNYRCKGYCGHRGLYGHYQRDCWKHQKGEYKGKSRGKGRGKSVNAVGDDPATRRPEPIEDVGQPVLTLTSEPYVVRTGRHTRPRGSSRRSVPTDRDSCGCSTLNRHREVLPI